MDGDRGIMTTQLYTDNELHIIADDLINEDNAQYIFGVLAEMRRRYEKRIAELVPAPLPVDIPARMPPIDYTKTVIVSQGAPRGEVTNE